MHHTGPRIYTVTWMALMGLTWLTVWLAGQDLGAWNVVGALSVATVKAALVGLLFMHLIEENRLTWGYLVLTGFTLVLMLGLILFDQRVLAWMGA